MMHKNLLQTHQRENWLCHPWIMCSSYDIKGLWLKICVGMKCICYDPRGPDDTTRAPIKFSMASDSSAGRDLNVYQNWFNLMYARSASRGISIQTREKDISVIHVMFSLVRTPPVSLSDVSSDVSSDVTATDNQMKPAVNQRISLGLIIAGNNWDNGTTQLNIYNKGLLVCWHVLVSTKRRYISWCSCNVMTSRSPQTTTDAATLEGKRQTEDNQELVMGRRSCSKHKREEEAGLETIRSITWLI